VQKISPSHASWFFGRSNYPDSFVSRIFHTVNILWPEITKQRMHVVSQLQQNRIERVVFSVGMGTMLSKAEDVRGKIKWETESRRKAALHTVL
jgi:hypothetical protein